MDTFANAAKQGVSPKIEVFSPEIVPVGWLDRFDSLQWAEKPASAGWFELWCPLDLENSTILVPGNILWQGDTSAAYIESIKKEMSERGLQLQIRGKMINNYAAMRIIWGLFTQTGPVSTILVNAVNQSMINPTNINRKIPFLKLGTQPVLGPSIAFQNTGGNLHDVLQATTETYDLGWEIQFNPFAKELNFVVTQGVDHTVQNTEGNIPVVFDSDMEDILSSSYFYNKDNLRNVALVAGQGEGVDRKTATVNNSVGLNRRELYVDARDISDQDQDRNPIPPEVVLEMLAQRGKNKLEECQIVETFDANIRVYGEIQYQYGVDYSKGDWVTVQDKALDIQINAKVTEVQKIYNDKGYSLNITFGYTQPTLRTLIKNLSM